VPTSTVQGTLKRRDKAIGRPRIEIDFDEFEKLCHFQCTLDEIAIWFGCSASTVEERVKEHYLDEDEKGLTFYEVSRGLRGRGKIGIKRKQFQRALGGSDKMLIHLGKQYLGQAEKHEISGPDGGAIAVRDDLAGMTNKQLEERLKVVREATINGIPLSSIKSINIG